LEKIVNKIDYKDLIKEVAKEIGLSQEDAGRCVSGVVDAIAVELKKGKEIILPGFGTFSTKKHAERMMTPPKGDGSSVLVSARRVVKFNPEKELKESVKGI
jgi:DNA-binding protein HU-beta